MNLLDTIRQLAYLAISDDRVFTTVHVTLADGSKSTIDADGGRSQTAPQALLSVTAAQSVLDQLEGARVTYSVRRDEHAF